MSGGVDSSVTALLLKQAGWKVLGITMNIPALDACPRARPCCGADAALVCRQLGVPHYFLDVEKAFHQCVIEPFRRDYVHGRTPNPCVDCNTCLKFDIVWDFIEQTFGITRLATGHYARVLQTQGEPSLAEAGDETRDQSYFLHGIGRARLSRLFLPIGEKTKESVRALAREAGLPVADRDDSMDLCFADEGDYRRALAADGATPPGPVLDTEGNHIARHNGIANYTVGQRRLGFATGKPLYVTHICAEHNTLTVGTREQAARTDVSARDPNVLIPAKLELGARLRGKIRSVGPPSACTVEHVGAESITVRFDAPQFAPCPGQRLVLYDDLGRVVAGATIADAPCNGHPGGRSDVSRTP